MECFARCFALPPSHVEGLFKDGDRVRVHGQKVLHFKSARSVLLADRAAVGWPTRTTLKGIIGLAGETIDLATMADPPVPGVQVINVPALEEEEEEHADLIFGDQIYNIDIWYSVALEASQRRCFKCWIRVVAQEDAERKAWKSSMSNVFTRRAKAEEAVTGLEPVRRGKSGRRGGYDYDGGSGRDDRIQQLSSSGEDLSGWDGTGPPPPGSAYKYSGGDHRTGLHNQLVWNPVTMTWEDVPVDPESAWRALRSWRLFRIWRLRAEERKRRQEVARKAVKFMVMKGDDRLKLRGLHAFASRSPFWDPKLSSPAVIYSPDRFWCESTVHQEREGAHGWPLIKAESKSVYRFGFRIAGSGSGMVVGVSDASRPDEPLEVASAWGLHLTHGALFTKHNDRSQRGTLSTKTLLTDVFEYDDEKGEPVDNVVDLTVEVDYTHATGGRISFGVAGGPLIEAPVALPSCVRPWAYLWNDFDSVALDGRLQVNRHRALKDSPRSPPKDPSAPGPLPLRLRHKPPPFSHTSAESLERTLSGLAAGPKVGYMPSWLLSYRSDSGSGSGTAIDGGASTATDGGATPKRSASASRRKRHGLHARIHVEESTTSPSKRWLSPRQPRRSTTPKSHSADEDHPHKEPLRSPGRASPRSASMLSPRSSRGRGPVHMWDMVRHVTNMYMDLPMQLKQQ